ncbi:unnamed protein product, partial [Didymodactylos carnosus]
RTQRLYKQMTDEIVQLRLNFSPQNIMMDYERATINVFSSKFLNAHNYVDAKLIHANAGIRQQMRQRKIRQKQCIFNILNDATTTNLEKVLVITQNITLKAYLIILLFITTTSFQNS